MMPGELDGLATLARLRESAPDVPVIMMSGKAGLSDAVKATKLGAFNFLEKPLSPEGVLLALASALELRRVRREARALREDLGLAGEMIGGSPAMATVREMIARVAPTDARVLVTGESGTGKELVAAAIHFGERAARPSVRARELRGDSARSRGERDVRPREGRVHRRDGPAHRALRAGAHRHALSRRGGRPRRSRRRPSCCARSRRARSSASAAANRSRSTCAS